MSKIFNLTKIDNLIKDIPAEFEISSADFFSKTLFNKFKKNIIKIENVNYLYNLVSDKNKFVQSIFPSRYEEIKDNFETLKLYFRQEDGKIVWIVHTNTDRTFKLKTDNYWNKIKDFIPEVILNFKHNSDKFYGYFKINNYITDKNLNNGKYRVLVKDNVSYSNAFSVGDLLKTDQGETLRIEKMH